MPALQKSNWEAYARGLAQGLSQTQAYKAAGFKSKESRQGMEVFKKREIQDRVKELIPVLQRSRAVTAVINREWVIAELVRLGRVAEEKGELSTARQCIKDVGEIIGAFDKTGRVKFDWDGDPANLTDSQLEKLKYFLERLAVGENEARELQRRRLGLDGVTVDVTPKRPLQRTPMCRRIKNLRGS